MSSDLHVVTGAFGYSGRYVAERLLAAGHRVRTLTSSPDRPHPFGDRVDVRPYDFERPDELARSLDGAAVLVNTYWVRFNHRDFKHADAVANTIALFDAARRAGVRRVVHVSITNPDEGSDLEYFAGKGRLERALRETGLPHSIVRPAVLFGGNDILINNIAWALRRLPVFGVFGRGDYRLQPMHVEDFADVLVAECAATGDRVVEGIGPETFTYRELVETLAEILGLRRWVVSVPPWLGHVAGWALGKLVGDVMITRDEIEGLMRDLLHVDAPPAGTTKLTDWARANAATLGTRYASELGRRRDRAAAYAEAS